MRTHINETATERLLEIMSHYGFTSTGHTLNVIIGSLHQSLFNEETKHKPIKEVVIHDQRSNHQHPFK